MLPENPKVGISETYGTVSICTPKLSNSNDGSQLKLSFESSIIHTNLPRQLAVIKTSYDNKIKPITKEIPKVKGKIMLNRESEDAENLIVNKNIKLMKPNIYADNFDLSINAFDPIWGNLCKVFTIHDKVYSIVPTGKDDTIIALAEIDPEWDGWYLSNSGIDNECELKSPKFKWETSLNISETILQINTYKTLNGDLILIRTKKFVLLLKCQIFKEKLQLKKVFKFDRNEKWGPLADSNMHISDDKVKIIVIDCLGKFTLFESDNTKKLIFVERKLKFNSYYEPGELSNFKKSLFINSNRLILYSRSQLHEYKLNSPGENDIKKEKFFCRICAGLWSKILDIQPSLQNKSIYYMLTTKEIILVDTTVGFKRKFAWKHFFSDVETSTHLKIMKAPSSDTNELCMISSRQVNINHVIEFNAAELKLVNKPYAIFTSKELPINDLFVYPVSDLSTLFLVVEKLEDGGIASCVLSYTDDFENSKIYGHINDLRKIEKIDHTLKLPSISEDILSKIYEKTCNFTKESSKTGETKKLYSNIASFLENDNITHESLFHIVDKLKIPLKYKNIIHLISSLSERESYEKYNFVLNKHMWLSDRSLLLDDATDIENISKEIYSFFKSVKGEGEEEIASSIVFYLIASLVGLEKNKNGLNYQKYEQKFTNSLASIPKEYRDILDNFEDDFDIEGIVDTDEIVSTAPSYTRNPIKHGNATPMVSVSQAPQITASQARNKSNSKSKSKSKKNLLSGFSSQFSQLKPTQQSSQVVEPKLESSQVDLSSQIQTQTQTETQTQFKFTKTQSQSKEPKKKKRRLGF